VCTPYAVRKAGDYRRCEATQRWPTLYSSTRMSTQSTRCGHMVQRAYSAHTPIDCHARSSRSSELVQHPVASLAGSRGCRCLRARPCGSAARRSGCSSRARRRHTPSACICLPQRCTLRWAWRASGGNRNTQHTRCNGQHAAYKGQHATYDGQHAAYKGQHATYKRQHAAYKGQHATYDGPVLRCCRSALCAHLRCRCSSRARRLYGPSRAQRALAGATAFAWSSRTRPLPVRC
jgi:hypothetical protein